MKLNKKIFSIFFILCIAISLTACGNNNSVDGKTKVLFWGYADTEEAETAKQIVNWYNENNIDNIYIDYQSKSSDSYSSLIDRALAGSKGPDVFYVGDRYLKRWTKAGYLNNLQNYVDQDNIDFSNIWTSAVQRYRYNAEKNTCNYNDSLYALPKDISTTALYYNKSVFERQGIKIISVDAKDLSAFNTGSADRNGKTKADLDISADFTVQAKGFYREQSYRSGNWKEPVYENGKVVENMIFNNRIAMSWEEIEDLAMILTQSYNSNLTTSDTKWGCYTEWWFNYGWGVGGDCLEDTTGNGDWTFTLGDTERKSILYNSDGSYAYSQDGKNIFVAESKQTTYQLKNGQYFGNLLPSQREAFERFVMLGKPRSAGGLEIAPRQTQDIGLQSSTSFFATGKIAMLVQSNYSISSFRKSITDFDWDVAPLPVYKEYESDRMAVKTQGVEIGHSGSTGLGMWTKSKNKDAAFNVIKYLSTGEAQSIQAKNGFLMPNDKTLAANEYVNYNLNSGKKPENIQIFTKYGDIQRPGDWWYMPDNAWIDVWATPLNVKFREDSRSLDEFFQLYTDATNKILAGYKVGGVI
jgi:multiple sugar transport system substrate-binding protein